jgi:hypothetical protein
MSSFFRPGAELADANSKIFEKVLDFWGRMWYTIIVKGRENRMRYRPMGIPMALEKKCKNPLTNHPSCDTIRVQKGRARQPRKVGAHESE